MSLHVDKKGFCVDPTGSPSLSIFPLVARMTLLTRFLAVVSVIVAIAYGDANGMMNTGSGGTDSKDDKNSVVLKTHSLVPPYLDSNLQSRWYIA